ncbi:hypothetical protein IC582_014887 [Cucumis melo]|uniref:14 kDa proline-rich protein DC2.15-like n=2 Tax=Cucumis melo TaxID=3656 RepID=A0A5D3CLJ3_CUCMM|nr:14 kDa proline-rich protein DC2.15-like [Cucumis melo var. makuwa]
MYSSNKTSPLALFFFLNLLFFSLVTSHQPVQPPNPVQPPSPTPPTNNGATCPRNTLNIAACANVLNLVSLLNNQPNQSYPPCCSLIQGLADLEARVCLCTALRLKVGSLVSLIVPINLNLIVNNCDRKLKSPYNMCPRV